MLIELQLSILDKRNASDTLSDIFFLTFTTLHDWLELSKIE